MRYLIVMLLSMLFSFSTHAQEKIITPQLLDKSVLSGVGLKKIDLKDEPTKEFYQRNLFWGKDLGVFVVSTENWVNKNKNYPFDEFVYMYHGEAVVTPDNAPSKVFHSGDYFFAPKGSNGNWEIRGGEFLHYELSVITTKRADSTKISKTLEHQLFDRAILSGTAIALNSDGLFEKILQRGLELSISLHAEKPREIKITNPLQEQLIHILSGQLSLTDEANNKKVFYSGDFLIIPSGFTGSWQSEGHGLLKYMSVVKTIDN